MSSFQYEHIHAADEEFTKRAAVFAQGIIQDAIEKRGKCTIGLSGGTTPGPIYKMLGASSEIDWSKVSVFLVDERYIGSDDQQSNQHMVRETLFGSLWDAATEGRTAVPHTVFPNTALLIDECVKDYEERLRSLLQDEEIDLVILGLGEDGHIASLFPGDMNALLEREQWVLQTETEKFAVHNRITVTLPVLEKAEKILFLLNGDTKKKMFAEVISANVDPIEYPAHALLQTGKTVWITTW